MKRNDKTSLFEQFQGSDLERLADCFVAIRKAGLSTSPYTQAGLNENSGNVWVWDEDWVGCVYCSFGFDIKWSWTCGDCGEEYDFDTYQEMDNFVSIQNDLTDCNGCESCHEVEVEA
jgi:hypothetical protein